MAQQPQPWRDRTLEVTPQDPWASPPVPVPGSPAAPGSAAPGAPPAAAAPTAFDQPAVPGPPPAPQPSHSFSRGVAHVKPAAPRTEPFAAAHEPTGTGWPGEQPPRQRRPVGWHLQQLRRGGEWTSAAGLFLFVCWGVWAISSAGSMTTAVLVLAVTLLVALGVFALSRLLGRVVLEKQLGRVRRTARGSHLVVTAFLVGVGVAHLRQVVWVRDAWTWLTGLASGR